MTEVEQTLTTISTSEVVRVHATTYIFLATINFAYFAQAFAVVGSGFLAQPIQQYFGGNIQSTWISQPIVIFIVVLAPLFSQIGDLWGRKWVTTCALVCGATGSIIASRATSMGGIIAGFCVMSIALGAQPLLHAVVSEILPRRQRPLAQASINTSSGISAIVGLCMGGSLLRYHDTAKFRIYLYLTASIFALAALGVAVLYSPPDRELQVSMTFRQKLLKIDWIGNLLFSTGLVLFCIALSWSRNPYPWSNAHVFAPFAVGIVLATTFFIYEWRFTKEGLLNHALLRRRNFSLSVLIIFVEGLTFFAANIWFVFQVSVFTQKDLLISGLHYALCFLVSIVFTGLTGIYSSAFKSLKLPSAVGFGLILVFNVAMAATSHSNAGNAYWGFAAILGAGIGIILPTVMVVAQLSTSAELISMASALLIATRALGGTIGLAINTALFNSALSHIGSNIAAAALPLGLPPDSLGSLIVALNSQNPQLLGSVPGATPQIISASRDALLHTYGTGFRDCWIASAGFCAVAVVASFFINDYKEEFNAHVDAPAETAVAEKQARLEGARAAEAADVKEADVKEADVEHRDV